MNYNSDILQNREWSIAKSLVYNIVLAIFLTLIIAVITIYVSKVKLDVVLSDSMADTFYKDDIVVIKQYDDYNVGDIIEFKMGNGTLVTHRIQEKNIEGGITTFVTKGDNNPSSDSTEVPISSVQGKVIAIIKGGNLIYEFVKTNYFMFIDIILGLWVLSSTISSEIEMRKHNIAKV